MLIVLALLTLGVFFFGVRSKRKAKARAKEYNAGQSDPANYSRNSTEREARAFGWDDNNYFGYLPAWTGFAPLVILLIVGWFTCTTTVNAKTEGVLLTFKAPDERLLDSGLAVKAPWQKVVEVDGTRKTDNFNNGKPNAEDDPVQDHTMIECRLGDNGLSKVYASINWSRAEGTSNRVYEQYRAEDPVEEMRESLVVPRFKDAINQTCGDYRPTESIDALTIDFAKPQEVSQALKSLDLAPDFAALSEAATGHMEDLLKPKDGSDPLITVEKVSISGIQFPKATEDRIQDFIDEATKTRTALQSQATSTATAEANRIIADSVSNDPFVLVSRCFDLISDGKLKLEPGTSCWPGGGSAVVLPSVRQDAS